MTNCDITTDKRKSIHANRKGEKEGCVCERERERDVRERRRDMRERGRDVRERETGM